MALVFQERTDGAQTGEMADNMAETTVISRRSVIHPHNLPALLESEDDERERKEARRESEREGERKRERERRGDKSTQMLMT